VSSKDVDIVSSLLHVHIIWNTSCYSDI